jgi:hypothetical protein
VAFTETQKDQIRNILGFAAGFYQYNTPLESMMDKVGANTVESASVVAILTELSALDAAIASQSATGLAQGLLKKADEVEFYDYQTSGGSEVIIPPKKRGSMLVTRLAKRFGYTIGELMNQGCAPWFFGASGSGSREMALG